MFPILCYISGFGILWFCTICVFIDNVSACSFYCNCIEQSMNCSNNEMFQLPNDLPSWITSLDMTNNQLNSPTLDFSKQLIQLTNLTELKLNKNALTNIPINHTLKSLTKLAVAHNRLVESSLMILDKLPNLQELDLKSNLLSRLDVGSVPNSTHLRVLNLNNNKISSVEKGSLDPFSKLTDLNLARNNLRNLNKEVLKNLTALKTLDLSRNRFFIVEGLSFSGLKALTTLKMKFNLIKTLEDGAFFGLDSLTSLYLDSNSVSEVTKGWLFGLSSLQLLSLSFNKIQSIDSVWEFCSDLRELDISNNVLRSIENNTLQYLSKLQTLKLDHNHISYIAEGAFNHTPSLMQLNLSGNKISWTIEDMLGPFVGLKLLTKLNLADNAITSVSEQALVGLDHLEYLDLSNNHIKTLHSASLNYTPLLRELRLDSVALVCDCHLAWLATYLHQRHLHTEMRCAYPSHLANHSLTSLRPHQFLCSPDDFPKPVIVEQPQSQVALSGSSVRLGCKAVSSSNSLMVFKWRRNNRDIAESVSDTNTDSQTHTSQLLLTNLSLDASALYQCIVSNDFGTVYSRKANLSVYTFPQLLKTPSNVTTKSGSMARLECSASGHPSPQIGWQKDGGTDFPAAQERRVHVMPTDDVFFIVNVKPVDSGVYSCTAQNIAGTVVANATLTVVEPPWFVKKMENKEVQAGEAVVLECMAGGSPKPCLRWTKDQGPLHLTDRHFFTAEDQLLIIMDTQLGDEGVYSCEMTNTLGSERGQVTLTVLPGYESTSGGEDMTGVIIITVVCCAVGTSIVWVIIIYQTRKRLNSTPPPPPPLPPDNKSEHSSSSSSKDSGTGDSTKRSHEDLLLESVSCVHQEGEQQSAPEVTLPLLTSFHPHPYSDTTPPPTATAVYKVPCCCDGASVPHPRTDHDRQPGYLCVPVYLPPS